MQQEQSTLARLRLIISTPKGCGREWEEAVSSEFQNPPIGRVIVSLEGKFLAANRAFSDFLGYSEEELLCRDILSITYSEDRLHTMGSIFKLVVQGKNLPAHEKRYLHKDGQVRWGELSATVVRGPEKDPTYFEAQVIDVTDRKQHEAVNSR
jgi:PAS domain S-box-containing protein